MPGRVPGRAAPSPQRPPFGFLAAPRPALLHSFLPWGRSVLISWGPRLLSCPPPRLGPSLGPPPAPGSGRRWEVEVEAGAGSLPPALDTLGGYENPFSDLRGGTLSFLPLWTAAAHSSHLLKQIQYKLFLNYPFARDFTVAEP